MDKSNNEEPETTAWAEAFREASRNAKMGDVNEALRRSLNPLDEGRRLYE